MKENALYIYMQMYIHTREHKLSCMYSTHLRTYVHTYWRSTSECAHEVSYLTPLRTHIVIRYPNSTDNITVTRQKSTHYFHDRVGPGGEELDGFNGHFINLLGGVVILSELATSNDL